MKQTIQILIHPIVDQINAKVYYMARIKSQNGEQEAIIADLAEGENEDIIASSIDKALNRLRSLIGLYAPVSMERIGTLGDLDISKEEKQTGPAIVIELTLPSNYNTEALSLFKETVGKYCESMVLHDWAVIMVPTEAEIYAQQLAMCVADIRRALMQRRRPTYDTEEPIWKDKIGTIKEEAQS